MLPLLKLAGDGQQHTLAAAVERLAPQEFQLSDADRAQVLQSGQTRLYNRVGWTTSYLRKAGLLRAVGPGRFQLTERGREVLASRPAAIDVAFLETRFPEMSEFRKAGSRGEEADEELLPTFNTADGTWNRRAGVEDRSAKHWNGQFRTRLYVARRCIFSRWPSRTQMRSAAMRGTCARPSTDSGS